MKKILLAVAALLLGYAAHAADLPVKAQPYLDYPTGNGWFWGVSASGLGGTTSASNGIASGNLIGGKAGLDVGYTGRFGNGFWFVEQNFNGQAIQGPANGLSISAQFGMEQRFAIGAPMNVVQQFAGLIPGLSSVAMPSVPLLPDNVTIGPSNPYLFVATYEDDVSASIGTATGKSWLFSYGAGVGMLNRASNGWMIDTSIEWKHSDTGLLLGAAVPIGSIKPFADAYLATARIKF